MKGPFPAVLPMIAVVGLAFAIPGVALSSEAVPSAPQKVSAMTISQRAVLERRINVIANKAANSRQFLYSDTLPIHIEAAFDPANESLIMHADERLGPLSGFPEVEEMQQEVQEALRPILQTIPSFQGLDWRYGGKDLYFWFPQDRVPSAHRSGHEPSSSSASAPVLVSAGHGFYYHHGYADWRAQRTPAHGVLEDEITTNFSSSLTAYLRYKNISVVESRPSNFAEHDPSGQPYYMIAARYRLKELLPDRPEIWHSLPDDTSDLREYKEDIRSRPLYANDLGAEAAIHLHTNANESDSARGTRVFFAEGRPDSENLGRMVLCYMREQIHSVKSYREYPVPAAPDSGNHGENRLAEMPSIIVEVGFHTNAQDAAAMQDHLFVDASMRGVAKGYRLFKEGKGCEEFKAEVPADMSGFVGDVLTIPVQGSGYPEFPVMLEGKHETCASGSCGGAYGVAFDESELGRASMRYLCLEDDVARSPFSLRVIARDSFGVESEPVQIALTCARRPA